MSLKAPTYWMEKLVMLRVNVPWVYHAFEHVCSPKKGLNFVSLEKLEKKGTMTVSHIVISALYGLFQELLVLFRSKFRKPGQTMNCFDYWSHQSHNELGKFIPPVVPAIYSESSMGSAKISSHWQPQHHWYPSREGQSHHCMFCHLTKHTVSAAVPPDNRSVSESRLWDSTTLNTP